MRVHRVPQLTRVVTCRRGTTPAALTSLAFLSDAAEGGLPGGGVLLAAASDHGTVHLFRVGEGEGTR